VKSDEEKRWERIREIEYELEPDMCLTQEEWNALEDELYNLKKPERRIEIVSEIRQVTREIEKLQHRLRNLQHEQSGL
jgi:predicted  nucleic acid-binding Zn-ribbon protein